jgi:hypothetical protein
MTKAILAALLTTVAATAVHAEEGMWLPRQTGAIAEDLKKAGLTLDAAQLGDLTKPPLTAIASLGGCSAAFLSPEGLVATNHHCVYGSIQYNSKPGQDYLTDGFLAASLADELPAAPGSRIYVIEDLRDVTRDMLKGAEKLAGRARYDRMEANRKALISACEKQPSRRCDVRPYFGGQTYFLQQQLEIQDVRLVYAPAGGVGNFGGETDNWMWPRHTGDFGFYRAYVAPDARSAPFAKENVPFKPKAHLKIAEKGVEDGDFVMVAGFPGVTFRHRTAAEAKFAFETLTPLQQRLLNDYSDLIQRTVAGNQAAAIKYASILKGADNYKKKYIGELAGAEAMGLIEKKDADEAAYRAWIAADPKRASLYGAAATELDRLIAAQSAQELADTRRALLGRAQLYGAARTAYRWAKERAKPDAQREPGFQDRDRAFIEQRLTAIERRFDPAVDRVLFEAAITEYRTLAPEQRLKSFDAALPADIGALYATTKLGDTKARLAWLDQPAAAFEASDDPFVRLAVATYAEERALEDIAKARSGDIQRARSQYMAGRLAYAASQGKTLYPDANGSLRFTYGKVTGRARDGVSWTPFTTAEGLAAKHTGKGEFDAPDKMIALIKAKDYGRYASPSLGTLPVDFLSTVDITNGNSGSSTLNAKGEFVGLAFDGTLDGVVADWMFNPVVNRTIHVDSRFMLWTMDKVDGARRLLDEMGVAR